MKRARLLLVFASVATVLLTVAPGALAAVRDNGGQGWYGETNDPVITTTMFCAIAFFPVVILTFSLIQWRLDKRKHAREDASRARAANADWRGGW